MGSRSALQQEVVDALIASKAVDFEAAGGVLGKFGSRIAREGDDFYLVIHKNMMDTCIPPDPFGILRVREVLAEQAVLEAGELKR